ncbi:TolC family protein [Telluribacter sp.]|jgi:outer membrane protein|uniref:TolC family protein n=1 Tax=Telluribacter sp. TaxID=1978767 RepID=UPI002E14DA01|nr:TolC family protein [Telluribacter sp.]
MKMNKYMIYFRKIMGMLLLVTASFVVANAQGRVTLQDQPNATVNLDEPLDLEESIGIALRNNPQLKQAELQVQSNGNIYEQSKWQRWPSLSFSASQGFSLGRNVDPFTNQFVQQNIAFNNYQLGSSVVLFGGFQTQNTIKQNSLTLQASQKDLAATRNDVMLNVALGYLQVLSNQELIEVARQQVEATRLQLERSQRLVQAGSLAESALFDLRAQQANDELSLVNAQNNLESAQLSLKQVMNLPGNQEIRVEPMNVGDPSLRAYDATVQEIFETAIQNLPQMQAAKLRTAAAAQAVEVARGARLPTLLLNGGVNTAYSSAAPRERFVADGSGSRTMEVPSASRFIMTNGIRVPVVDVVTIPNGAVRQFGYFDQLDFNRNASFNFSLRVPIFTNYQTRYQISNARIQQMNTEYQGQIVLLQIRQNVEQAYIDMSNSAKRYVATLNQVQAQAEAFRVAESRFGVGAINSAEYNIAKANLDRSRANLVQTKYDYVFRTKILDFYMNRPLTE